MAEKRVPRNEAFTHWNETVTCRLIPRHPPSSPALTGGSVSIELSPALLQIVRVPAGGPVSAS